MKLAVTTVLLGVRHGAVGLRIPGHPAEEEQPLLPGCRDLPRTLLGLSHAGRPAGAQGSATSINNRVKTSGPNFNIRKEKAEQVLYALRNGGFSGAIMPQNIVVGEQAQAVAYFLAKYSGRNAQHVPATEIPQADK